MEFFIMSAAASRSHRAFYCNRRGRVETVGRSVFAIGLIRKNPADRCSVCIWIENECSALLRRRCAHFFLFSVAAVISESRMRHSRLSDAERRLPAADGSSNRRCRGRGRERRQSLAEFRRARGFEISCTNTMDRNYSCDSMLAALKANEARALRPFLRPRPLHRRSP